VTIATSPVYELAPQQRAIFEATRRAIEGPGKRPRCQGLAQIEGPLDHSSFERAINAVIAAHDILRTRFAPLPGLRLPVQRISDEPAFHLIGRELAAPHAMAEAIAGVRQDLAALTAADETSRPGVGLIRVAPDSHLLLLDFAAMTADGRTLGLFCDALARAYAADRPQSAVQFADLSTWLNDLRQTEYWTLGQRFWGRIWSRHDPVELATQRLSLEPRGGPGVLSDSVDVQLFAPICDRILALAKACGAPVAAVMLAAWATIVGRLADVDRQVIGYGCDLRSVEGIGSVLGPCRTVVPVSLALTEEATFAARIDEAMAEIKAAEAWQQVFDWPVADVDGSGERSGAAAAFFPFAFDSQSGSTAAVASGIAIRLCETFDLGMPHALRLLVDTYDDAVAARLEFDSARFDRATAMHIGSQVVRLLAAGTEAPDREVAYLMSRADDDAHCEGTITVVAAPPPLPFATVHAGFCRQAARTPDRVAVDDARKTLNFAELNLKASHIAHRLIRWGAGPDVPVALCLPRCAEAVAAILGILKAGACFVPISPTDPAERIAHMVRAVNAPIVVTVEALRPHLPAFEGQILSLDRDAESLAAERDAEPAERAGGRQAAYIIHTSGSTGHPKGVVVEHRSALALFQALDAMLAGTLPDRPLRVSLNAPFTFDASIQQLMFLLRGDCLMIIPDEIRLTPPAMNAFLRRQSIDVFDATPSHLRRMVEAGLTAAGGPRLAAVLMAGEVVDLALWSRLADFPGTAVFNLYGPTEATVDATGVCIRPGVVTPTIGRELPGYAVYLLDRDLWPVDVGVPGEIYIGGPAVARGYQGQPALTADRFLPDPHSDPPGGRMYATGDRALVLGNGELLYLGRNDAAFKLRGVRIDPGEIEGALSLHPGIRQAVVMPTEGPQGEPVIAAHLRMAEGAVPDRTALRHFLRGRLPEAMIPSIYSIHEEFPLLPSGKVDRAALAAAAAARQMARPIQPPRTPTEAMIAGIWQVVLKLPAVGRDENFFELGGHSLLLFQVQQGLAKTLGRAVPLTDLITLDTIAALAAHLETPATVSGAVEAGAMRAEMRRRLRSGGRTSRRPRRDGRVMA
jgi:amino acid adenylation domain-containing protein